MDAIIFFSSTLSEILLSQNFKYVTDPRYHMEFDGEKVLSEQVLSSTFKLCNVEKYFYYLRGQRMPWPSTKWKSPQICWKFIIIYIKNKIRVINFKVVLMISRFFPSLWIILIFLLRTFIYFKNVFRDHGGMNLNNKSGSEPAEYNNIMIMYY